MDPTQKRPPLRHLFTHLAPDTAGDGVDLAALKHDVDQLNLAVDACLLDLPPVPLVLSSRTGELAEHAIHEVRDLTSALSELVEAIQTMWHDFNHRREPPRDFSISVRLLDASVYRDLRQNIPRAQSSIESIRDALRELASELGPENSGSNGRLLAPFLMRAYYVALGTHVAAGT
jgi:hypothetical protein